MTDLTNTISIGNDYLQQKVKRDYSDHKVALVREFLQNSLDASARNLTFKFNPDERTLTVTDDGCGMDADIMVNSLFDIGGSFKKDGAVGGFGAAKLILLFQHASYNITSWRNGYRYDVQGSASKYSEITKTIDTEGWGTHITIKFLPSWAEKLDWTDKIIDEYTCFQADAISYLATCEFGGCKVTWNDVVIQPNTKNTLIKTLNWCEIYTNETDKTNSYLVVRIRGIKMFDIYVGEMKKEIIVELTHNSLNILTSNRDGLLHSFRKELDTLIAEVNIDKVSFTRLKGKKLTYAGKDSVFISTCQKAVKEYTKKILSVIELHIEQAKAVHDTPRVERLTAQRYRFQDDMNDFAEKEMETFINDVEEHTLNTPHHKVSAAKTVVARVFQALQGKTTNIELDDAMMISYEMSEKYADILSSTTVYDFLIDVQGDIKNIPSNMDPEKGLSPKYYKLAQMWKHSIDFIARKKGIDMQYKIGWVVCNDDDKTTAMYSKRDGGHVFFINPLSDTWKNAKNKAQQIKRIFRIACHEMAHKTNEYHDERYVNALEQILEVQDDVANWKTFEMDAYLETI